MMPRGPIAWMARNTVASNLLMLLFLAGGALTLLSIRKEFFPDISEDTVSITVAYPGAGPEEVEQGIIRASEEAIRAVDGVKDVTSVAKEGLATITARLLDSANDMKTYQDIRSEIDRIRTMPEDAEEPIITLDINRHMVLSLALWGDADEKSLRALAEVLRERLLADPDISQLEFQGIRPLEISIEVPRENLRKYGLTLDDIAMRLRLDSVEIPSGAIKATESEILVRVKERRENGKEFELMPVITNPDGTVVLLGDIAKVTDGFEDADYFSTYDRHPAVLIDVYRAGDQTPIQVHQAVEKILEEMRPQMPKGTNAKIMHSLADMYKQRMMLLLKNGIMGLILVLLLLGAFLELRLALWVMMGIPVSFLGAVMFMPLLGISINMITMFAFILALGIVVDDAIVVGENIYHRYQNGEDFMTAAIKGTQEVATPIAFSILTNIAAFIPLLLLPGIMGKFMRMLPAVVILAFLISWIECLVILPAHLGHHRDKRKKGGFLIKLHLKQQKFSHAFRRFVNTKYSPFLERALKHRYIVFAAALAILISVLGYAASGRMGFELFTTVESDFAFGTCILPYGSPAEKTEDVLIRMENAAKQAAINMGSEDIVRGVFATVGQSGSHAGSIIVYLPDADEREKLQVPVQPGSDKVNTIKISTLQFVEEWRKVIGTVPGAKMIRLQADMGGPGAGAALTVELTHENMETLQLAAEELASELEKLSLVKESDSGYQTGNPQIDFNLTPAGQSAGLTSKEVARQLRNAYEGSEVVRQQRGRDELKVKVRLPESERTSEFDLADLTLLTPTGGEIPLMEAVTFKRSNAYTSISRRNGQRTLSVTADIKPKSKTGQVQEELNSSVLPALMEKYPGLNFSYEGQQATNRESFGALWVYLGMVAIAIYALLAVPFRSYIQPVLVMTSIPFGLIGALIGHMIMGYNLTMLGVIGILALSGVVVNDSLILIDFANRKRKEGKNSHDAVVDAASQRFRPIMLTTLTTFGGLMPMIFENSMQAKFLIPMAISLGFGLLFATLITLLLLPSLYMIQNDVVLLYRKWFRPETTPEIPDILSIACPQEDDPANETDF